MVSLSRRAVMAGLAGAGAAVLAPTGGWAHEGERLRNLTLWGPPAGPSILLVQAIATGRLRAVADKVTFKAWRDPDELRAGLTSGSMQLFVLPTQAAANLFNRGMDVRLVNVMTNGLLYVAAADGTLTTLAALRGRSVAVPFRNDTPDVLFRRLLRAEAIAEADLDLRFTGTPLEAAQLLASGRIDAALLPEPAASAAILKASLAGTTLSRVIDMQAAWARVTGLPPALPQAGLGVTGDFLTAHDAVVQAVHAALVETVAEVNAAPAEAAASAASALGLPQPVIAESIPYSNLVATPAREARPVLEPMFASLAEADPGIVGGGSPAAAFYL